ISKLKDLKVIAFTHKQFELDKLGCLVLCNEAIDSTLQLIRDKFSIPEIFYLGTCNRVEFIFTSNTYNLDKEFVSAFLDAFHHGRVAGEDLEMMVDNCG